MLLGKRGSKAAWQLIGFDDNRHVVTVAGSRAGKSSTVLIPNLLRYPGSTLVLDPKGELARATADARRAMGQQVHILDPFGATGQPSQAHNPFDELAGGNPEHIGADAALLADALIISNDKDPHWTDSAKNLLRGITLHLLSTGRTATIRELRRLLNADPDELEHLLKDMVNSDAFDGAVANVGAAFLGKATSGGEELQSILSTAQEQTTPLDDVRKITDRSDFRLRDLKRGPVTIYLVLPAMRMATHSRWLRLVIQQAFAAMELDETTPAHPVLFLLEEFPVLGHLRAIETAAGFVAGFGVKLWTVVQDFSQLKVHYPKSWETFLGNAGIIQAFGNVDLTTTEYLSKRLGNLTIVEEQNVPISSSSLSHGDLGRREHLRQVPLLDASEITRFFARETGRQLLLCPGRPPIYCDRLSLENVAVRD
ncbi:type IV secretory system conjugative DNA transfer family protein [Reyranella aquatilis]|uniref:Type IV secretory system conjugative DNA transfer family protein n=1 Tax=Reyranella aquatilis TaxID=2035356 RepID=A0ABS8KUZ9_9HYPH|nr:type IV secretory system conjugative DNA transfer family protein [Reyranella aquatilis]MCC8429890.1 type IV secretory system conjugative DNA transfer family protein [Reyranella aquatilis]